MKLNAIQLESIPENKKVDITVDCTGNNKGINLALKYLVPRGKLVLKTTVANPLKIDLNQIVINEFSVIGSRCGPFKPAINLLTKKLINVKPLINKMFEFEDLLKAFKEAGKKFASNSRNSFSGRSSLYGTFSRGCGNI